MHSVPLESIEKNFGEYFKYVEQTGEQIIITDQKRIPVLILSKYGEKRRVEDVFRDIRGRIQYHEDILQPETEEWGEHLPNKKE